jgi:hypothetical protein
MRMTQDRAQKLFSQYWKNAADIEGDLGKDVKNVYIRKRLEFF